MPSHLFDFLSFSVDAYFGSCLVSWSGAEGSFYFIYLNDTKFHKYLYIYKDCLTRIKIERKMLWFGNDSTMVGKNFEFCISSMPRN